MFVRDPRKNEPERGHTAKISQWSAEMQTYIMSRKIITESTIANELVLGPDESHDPQSESSTESPGMIENVVESDKILNLNTH